MRPKLILDHTGLELTINRLCYQLIEEHDDFSSSAIIGLQPRGVFFARRIKERLSSILNTTRIPYGELDVTFFRDDYRRRDEPLVPQETSLDFMLENRKVILVDDVLFTGRTIRAGLDAMLSFGRPDKVELMVLIDRRYSRHVPIEPNYVGKVVDSVKSEKVKVGWDIANKKNAVWLITSENEQS